MFSLTKRSRLAAAAVGCSLTLAACGGGGSGGEDGGLSGTIQIDGSSTVAPLSEAAAEGFQDEHSGVTVAVGTSGTGGGFEKFCVGETDISNASRPIKEEEAAACESNGVQYEEIQVANDGLAVVVNPDNPIECMTVEQLTKLWAPGSKVSNFKELDPSFPDQQIKLFGAGTDSGTFDYFTEEINGETGAIRTDYQPSEDDNVTVQGVQGNPGGLGFFGLSYVEENADAVKAIAIDGGAGCVEPSVETVLDGTYTPLGRPLFIYATTETVARPEGLAFLEFYISENDAITEQALFVPLSDEQKSEALAKIETLKG
ncbi:MAG: PstS family phosphate ABC transporter substrate-binding protein [Mycobacteriales bacterium]